MASSSRYAISSRRESSRKGFISRTRGRPSRGAMAVAAGPRRRARPRRACRRWPPAVVGGSRPRTSRPVAGRRAAAASAPPRSGGSRRRSRRRRPRRAAAAAAGSGRARGAARRSRPRVWETPAPARPRVLPRARCLLLPRAHCLPPPPRRRRLRGSPRQQPPPPRTSRRRSSGPMPYGCCAGAAPQYECAIRFLLPHGARFGCETARREDQIQRPARLARGRDQGSRHGPTTSTTTTRI